MIPSQTSKSLCSTRTEAKWRKCTIPRSAKFNHPEGMQHHFVEGMITALTCLAVLCSMGSCSVLLFRFNKNIGLIVGTKPDPSSMPTTVRSSTTPSASTHTAPSSQPTTCRSGTAKASGSALQQRTE